jgi:hypothetical protein
MVSLILDWKFVLDGLQGMMSKSIWLMLDEVIYTAATMGADLCIMTFFLRRHHRGYPPVSHCEAERLNCDDSRIAADRCAQR